MKLNINETFLIAFDARDRICWNENNKSPFIFHKQMVLLKSFFSLFFLLIDRSQSVNQFSF